MSAFVLVLAALAMPAVSKCQTFHVYQPHDNGSDTKTIHAQILRIQMAKVFDPRTGTHLPSSTLGIEVNVCDWNNKSTQARQSGHAICLHTKSTTNVTGLRMKITFDLLLGDYVIESQKEMGSCDHLKFHWHQMIGKMLDYRPWGDHETLKNKLEETVHSIHPAVWWLLLLVAVATVVAAMVIFLNRRKAVRHEEIPPIQMVIPIENPRRGYFTRSGREVKPPRRYIDEIRS